MNSSIPKLTSKLPTKVVSVRAPRRRSNSFGELNDKLTSMKSTSTTRLKDIQNFKRPVQPVRGGLRRSMSHGDLRATQTASRILPTKTIGSTIDLRAPQTASKILPMKSVGSTVKGIKRQNAIVGDSSTKRGKLSPPKVNKAPKPAKPAPYDYKARFNLLLEKHKIIKESTTEAQQQLNERTEELERANALVEIQSAELISAKATITKLQRECGTKDDELRSITKENERHKNSLEALEAEKENLQRLCTSQKAELARIKTTLNDQSNELVTYKEKCEELTAQVCEYSRAEVSYKEALQKAEQTRRYMHNHIQELKGNIRVFCRVRPTDSDHLECSINYLNESTLEIKKSKESISLAAGKLCELKAEFNFDRVYPPQAQQQEIFDELSQLVQSAIDGYHVCVFAYGQTGSGKTYTMQGMSNPHQQGMIPRSITWLFNLINQVERSDSEYQIQASFLEIYNETVRDLLKPNSKEKLCIQYNEGKGVIVSNLTIAPVETAEQLMSLMESANINRAVAVTDFNEHSSRSHAVTKIYLKCLNKSNQSFCEGSLNFVDLAGSESAKTSSCERLCETKNINKSLSALGTVMLALHNKNTHVPYRNSKLTYLLQSCLGGNSKTLMILNVSPFEDCYSETMNSLRFATKVKNVKTECKRNRTYAKDTEVE